MRTRAIRIIISLFLYMSYFALGAPSSLFAQSQLNNNSNHNIHNNNPIFLGKGPTPEKAKAKAKLENIKIDINIENTKENLRKTLNTPITTCTKENHTCNLSKNDCCPGLACKMSQGTYAQPMCLKP